jgi:cyanophycinase
LSHGHDAVSIYPHPAVHQHDSTVEGALLPWANSPLSAPTPTALRRSDRFGASYPSGVILDVSGARRPWNARRKRGAVSKSDGGRRAGKLLVMGGAADPGENDVAILRRLVEMAGGKASRVLVCSAAAESPEETIGIYRTLFRELGAEVIPAPIAAAAEACAPGLLKGLERATAVFFTAGDPVRLTERVAGTRFHERVRERLLGDGLVVAGTSAGAGAIGDTTITGGRDEGTVRRADVSLAPGLGFWPHAVVDTHLNQRGRLNRLLTAFAENPELLGIGIDEGTAVVVEPGRRFTVAGEGAVIVLAGTVSHTSAPEADDDDALAITDVRMHVLACGYGYDLRSGRPALPRGGAVAKPPSADTKPPRRARALTHA